MKHKIKLSEIEMKTILETINKTGYAGIHSNLINKIRRKMTVKPAPEIDSESARKRKLEQELNL